MKKKMLLPAIAAAILPALLLSACQENPDSSIVKNKDLDNMISQAQDGENGSANVGELAGEYDTWKTAFQDESLHVSVNVDAKVEIPKSTQMSVFRVKQKKIEQTVLDKVKKELVQEEPLYDGSVLSVQTRKDIEKKIQAEKNELENLKAKKSEYDEESYQIYRDEAQARIDELQELFENAPTQVQWKDFPSDGKIQSVESLYKKDKNNGFYAWAYELNASGDIYYGVTDGKNEKYTAVYAQNNENYGNCLRYSRDRHTYANVQSAAVQGICNSGMWRIDKEISEGDVKMDVRAEDLEAYTDVSATMTEEQAKEKADALLKSFGFTDFQYYQGGLYGEILAEEPDSNGKFKYRKVFYLKYLRNIDGIFVNNEGGSKFTDGWQGDSYVKKEWGGESIEITVNDDGVAGFCYSFPMEITEAVVDQSNMKPFEEIKDIFKEMAPVVNATQDSEETVSINVDRIILRYTRVSEQDSFDSGLLVPVWDFMGSRTDTYGERTEEKDTCIMTINAIDGSIIDKRLGY